MISCDLIIEQYEEEQRQQRLPATIQRRRKTGHLTRDDDKDIAATVGRFYMRPGLSVAEWSFGQEWDKPDARNPLGCLAYASRNGWFNPIHRAGQAREMARLAANGWSLADFT